jgi:hypothetical protein
MRRGLWVMVFLTSGFVSAQSQVATNLLLRQRPMIGTTRQKLKILIPHHHIIAVNALAATKILVQNCGGRPAMICNRGLEY